MDDRLTAEEVHQFIAGRTVQSLDPETGELAATIAYREDGVCVARFADGSTDDGQYGFVGDCYWTRYATFRNGTENRFYLIRLGPDRAQAYFDDGRRAFLQISPSA